MSVIHEGAVGVKVRFVKLALGRWGTLVLWRRGSGCGLCPGLIAVLPGEGRRVSARVCGQGLTRRWVGA